MLPTPAQHHMHHMHHMSHCGQAHAMVSGTAAEPPQFDDFFRAAAASLRGSGFMALGSPEAALWRRAE